jgi:hypothetical protein
VCCSISMNLNGLCGFSCYWFLILFYYGLLGYRGLLQSFCICWGLLYDLGCGFFWKKFHGLLRNCVICCRNMKYSIRSIRLISSMELFSSMISLWIFLFCQLKRLGCWDLSQLLLSVPICSLKLRSVCFYECGGFQC